MFMCIYQKVDNVIVQLRNDTSIPQTTSSKTYFDLYCQLNKINSLEFNFAELEYQDVLLETNKYVYDQTTNTIVQNANYVEPSQVVQETIPTTQV